MGVVLAIDIAEVRIELKGITPTHFYVHLIAQVRHLC